MIRRRRAPACVCLAAMIQSSAATAGVWSMDPVLGAVGDYSTNPALLNLPHTAQANGAALLDAPTTYNGDAFELFVLPSFRIGDSKGYSSLASDYEHLNVKAEWDNERGALSATAGVARDSSLYYDYLTNGGAGVRRDTALADLNWERQLTERMDFDTDVSTQRVRYGAGIGAPTLVDYKYTSITPTLAWNTSEKNKLTLTASVGRYNSLDGTTESTSANLQAGLVRQWSEIWSATATAGYSRAENKLDSELPELVLTPMGLGIVLVPFEEKSTQTGTVYLANVARQGSRLTLNLTASRQLTPTGFAYLSRQDTYDAKGTYALSARWSLSGEARYVNAHNPELTDNPQLQTLVTDFRNESVALSASWRWTELLTLTVSGSRVTERIQSPNYDGVQSPNYDVAANELTITLSHQFNHIEF
jgi:hypothetical protein